MPNRHTTLTSLFTDVADAIRAKTGDTADIKADDFDTAIAAIPSGGGGVLDSTIVATVRFDGDSISGVTGYPPATSNLPFSNSFSTYTYQSSYFGYCSSSPKVGDNVSTYFKVNTSVQSNAYYCAVSASRTGTSTEQAFWKTFSFWHTKNLNNAHITYSYSSSNRSATVNYCVVGKDKIVKKVYNVSEFLAACGNNTITSGLEDGWYTIIPIIASSDRVWTSTTSSEAYDFKYTMIE